MSPTKADDYTNEIISHFINTLKYTVKVSKMRITEKYVKVYRHTTGSWLGPTQENDNDQKTNPLMCFINSFSLETL